MSNRLNVATRKGLFRLERTGRSAWRVATTDFLGAAVTAVLPDKRDGAVYAAVGHGHFGAKFHRADKGGQFQEITSPAYPPRPEGTEPDRCPQRGIEIPWNLELAWIIEAGGANEPGTLWCGTLPGGLFRSRDRGQSWELIRSLWDHPGRNRWFGGGYDYPGIHSVCVDPRDARHITVGVSCGGVWDSRDSGEGWKLQADGMRAAYMPPDQANDPGIQDPHRVVQCPSKPDYLWAQHHNGVFRSTDGAKSWHEVTSIKPSGFGFGVAVHPRDPDTAWFAPAQKDEVRIPVHGQVVIARTRDGGESCEVLREGLPQEQAYDLVYRHALDIDETGDVLAFGSTTGSLWVSNNQGDKWEQVSAHLPPILALRFS
jgi:hypothetical protein